MNCQRQKGEPEVLDQLENNYKKGSEMNFLLLFLCKLILYGSK